VPTLALNLSKHHYRIHIGKGLLAQSAQILAPFKAEKYLVVSNETVAPLYLAQLKTALSGAQVQQLILADGENEKNFTNLQAILDCLIEYQFRRNDMIIALGGGVVGDLAGFAAAIYQRGMQLLQLPTSLLAQVDSSVGGKTAINHAKGKNLIGAFYQPNCVIIDTQTLSTLPQRQYLSGLAEVAKYALLGETGILSLLEEHSDKILSRDEALLATLIEKSCLMKADIVAKDEREQGIRALLNLGHTFAHGIELLGNYQQYTHGEAVAIGMQMALNLSFNLSLLDIERLERYKSLLQRLQLPSRWETRYGSDDLLDAMRLDKKNRSKKYRLVLPTSQGCKIMEIDNEALIKAAIEQQMKSD